MENKYSMSRQSLLKEIMTYSFAETELTLFLDTHPNDLKALEMHESVARKLKELKAQYNQQYGPLTSVDSNNLERWTWIEGPWPWEN